MSKWNTFCDCLSCPEKIIVELNKKKIARFLPDKLVIKASFKYRTGKKFNLKHPTTFNEKLNWLKLHDRKPIYSAMVDKCEAKKYVAGIIGEEYIIPTLGVWDRFDEIDFDKLPDRFVLKSTHDSGGLFIVRDKSNLDKAAAREKIECSLKRNYYLHGREWPYKNVKPRIIAEEYMEDASSNGGAVRGLTDYKFFCFNGEPKMLYVSKGLEDHSTARISFYDMDCREMPFHRNDFKPFDTPFVPPENFEGMKKTAAELAKAVDAPFVRIDLYSINKEIKFSEITFSTCNGMLPFDPPEWDRKLGDWIDLQK